MSTGERGKVVETPQLHADPTKGRGELLALSPQLPPCDGLASRPGGASIHR